MTATADVAVVTEPGVYDSMPDHVYHGDPVPEGSLSSSGARAMLAPSCPAIFKWQRDNGGRPDTRSFDVGHAAHKVVLGTGPEIVVVQKVAKDGTKSDAGDYATKSAQEHRDEIRATGGVPVLAREFAEVQEMAKAIRRHPIASLLLEPDSGTAESSLFWRDERSGVMLRARLDWRPEPRNGRLIVPDYKTAASADPGQFAKSAANYGYPQQDDFYTTGCRALELAEDIAFVFVVQEKTPPYLVSVCELDVEFKRIGRRRNRQAIDLYAYCVETDTWPEHGEDVALVSPPGWYVHANEEDL